MDLHDLAHNTRDGVHIASLAGAWIAAVAGFGGVGGHGGELTFPPRPPPRLARLAFRLLFRGRRLMVDVGKESATYSLLEGDPLEVEHFGEAITVSTDRPVTREIPPAPDRPAPAQPSGRGPVR